MAGLPQLTGYLRIVFPSFVAIAFLLLLFKQGFSFVDLLAKRIFQRGDTGEIVLTHDHTYNIVMFFLQQSQ